MYEKLLDDNGHLVTVTNDREDCLIVYNEKLNKIREFTSTQDHMSFLSNIMRMN
jgi:hypothetical protein